MEGGITGGTPNFARTALTVNIVFAFWIGFNGKDSGAAASTAASTAVGSKEATIIASSSSGSPRWRATALQADSLKPLHATASAIDCQLSRTVTEGIKLAITTPYKHSRLPDTGED